MLFNTIQFKWRKKFTVRQILTEDFVRELHVRMFGAVWKWAGTFRRSNKNIGVDKHQIAVELKTLLDDCKYWIDNKSFPDDEIAIRFKYRIVAIHCFPNGNGRHSRLIADILIEKVFNRDVFSWGGRNLAESGQFRSAYINALHDADKDNHEPLLLFARS